MPGCARVDSECARPWSGSDRRLVECGPLDLAHLVDLDDVALLDVVEVREVDTAFEALGDLARVILEPAELVDRGLVDDRTVTDDAGAAAAPRRSAAR